VLLIPKTLGVGIAPGVGVPTNLVTGFLPTTPEIRELVGEVRGISVL
jgi:hypothetical protein